MNKRSFHIKFTITLVVLCLISVSTFSQTQADMTVYNKAEEYIQYEEYLKAVPLYKVLADKFSENANFNFKAAYTMYMVAGKRDSALAYFLKAEHNVSTNFNDDFEENKAPIETYLYIAKIYHANYKFDKAITYFEKFESLTEDEKSKEQIQIYIEECKTGKEFISKPLDMAVMQVGGGINSIYDEHSPVLSADLTTLIFTSKRKGTGDLKDKFNKYHEDIYISKLVDGKWTAPKNISPNINTEGHEASVGLSADGRTLFIYKHNHGGDIYYSNFSKNEWSKPQSLGKNVNSRHRETHASLSADGNTLYFSSDRPGGFGGMDIYKSQKKKNGKWGKAVNVGSNINTKLNEEGPYIHPDNNTLFFSSNGHKGMGGYDLFVCQKKC